MKAAHSKTVVIGTLKSFEPATDGPGGDVEIEVAINQSPDPDTDFIKPKVGETMRAYFAQFDLPGATLLVGQRVRVQLTFLGGPFGGRAVVQSLSAE